VFTYGLFTTEKEEFYHGGHGVFECLRRVCTPRQIPFKKNFQYSILENFNKNTPIEYILKREKWWKIALGSIEHGYNKN
jgi:hypothetical protein